MSLYSRKLFINKRKRALKQILVGLSLFMLGVLAFYCMSALDKKYLPAEWANNPLSYVLIMTLICISAYQPLDYIISEVFRRYLFKKRSYVHIMLMNLAEELETVLDLQELSNLVVNTFGEILHLKTVALFMPNEEKEEYNITSAYGWNLSDTKRVAISFRSELASLIKDSAPHILVRNTVVRTLEWRDANRLSHDFDAMQASWLVPLVVKNEVVGILAFSAFQPERTFDETDFQFFRKFANSLGKKVKNAEMFLKLSQKNVELQDAQSKLIQVTKLKAIEQLATGVAHQIHNPLTIISGKAQVLLLQKKRYDLDDRIEDVLKTIVKQTKRAADITKKLLMFSQGTDEPKEFLRLGDVLEDTIALISYQTSLDSIEITQDIAPDMPMFYGNIHETREVMFNLILNAVQSVDSGGRVHIEMNYQDDDQAIEIRVSDNGRGVEKELVDKMFTPFFTTRHEALGLGLFVTKQIVHRYGGSIRAESRVGEGSLFIVQLPCQEAVNETLRENKLPINSVTDIQ